MRFYDEVPMDAMRHPHRLQHLLRRLEALNVRARDSDAHWEATFFDHPAPQPAERIAVEAQRLANHHALNAMRRHFTFLRRQAGLRRVKWEIATPLELAMEYARVMRDTDAIFAPPAVMPNVSVSHTVPSRFGVDYWLRFSSPAMADTVVARVHEPVGIPDPPSVIFFHGVGVDFDHWRGQLNEAGQLCRMGFRVIRPEAPWHGRRIPCGYYGGEKFVASLPLGSLRFFSAQIREGAVLIDWCRRRGRAPVAVGGSSLGAHVARTLAARARDWPPHLHPNAMLLVMPCGRLEEAAVEGAFARVWGTAQAAGERGWAPDLRRKWLSLLDPSGDPVVNPDQTVVVLGTRDTVTPFRSGLDLVDQLRIPPDNRFVWPNGHFTVPLRLMRDKRPLLRLCELMSPLVPKA